MNEYHKSVDKILKLDELIEQEKDEKKLIKLKEEKKTAKDKVIEIKKEIDFFLSHVTNARGEEKNKDE